MTRRWSYVAVFGFAILTLQGCGDAYYPADLQYEFTPYSKKVGDKVEKVELDAAQAQETAEILKPYFGTPRNPMVGGLGYDGADDALVKPEKGAPVNYAKADAAKAKERGSPEQLQLSAETLKEGSKVYRQNCLYCHGINGDGGGPTGQFLNPRPRDFRLAEFKFYSTAHSDELGGSMFPYPSREDLKRTVREGIPTANMPSFRTLSETELDQVVSYVIHLSFRGYVQLAVAKAVRDGKRNIERTAQWELANIAKRWFSGSWGAVETAAPPDWFVSLNDLELRNRKIARGREIYLSDPVGCVKCHGTDGRASREEIGPDSYDRLNNWGEVNPPRDLTQGLYRGGSRPVDIYYRIRLGILPSDMPGKNLKELSEEEAWALVQYVMSLPEKKYPYSK